MARNKKRGRSKKEEISPKTIEVAKEAGFVDAQIEKYTSDAALKKAIIRTRPGLAVRFIEKPPKPEVKEETYIDKECKFDVSILAGFGPIKDHMHKESDQIDRMVRRRGISVFDIQSMTIERSFVASNDGRKHSTITVKYRKKDDGTLDGRTGK